MLDNLLKRIKEEIAIDGPSGSNINTVWEYVKNISSEIATQSEASIDPLIDDNYKSLVWNYLKVETDLEFFTNDDPSTDNTNLIEADPVDRAVVAENLQSIEHEEINPEEVNKTQTTVTEDKPVEDAKENNNSSSVSETVTATRNKRKEPPVKAKSTPKKKAKPKSKPKRKLKPKKKKGNADSEDDFDPSFEESSSESSADFSDESDEDNGFDVEDESDDESTKPKEKKTNKAEPKIVHRYNIADQKAEVRYLFIYIQPRYLCS
ncbi:MAG: hypothetical protein EXX96DRAFT_372610 [Benjaminiella poitrasii]|nr:MAG: hypothetical protein EXX96DRAFT_372610 [Benjaminiella poitrasii]